MATETQEQSFTATLLTRLRVVNADLDACGDEETEAWRLEALLEELHGLIKDTIAALSPVARPIHRATLIRLLDETDPETLKTAGRRSSQEIAAEFEAFLQELPAGSGVPNPTPQIQSTAIFGPQGLASLRASLRRGERNRLRATLRELRYTRAELANRDLKGFRPDELKLITSLSDRLLKSWPFRLVFFALLLTFAFALTGEIKVENAQKNFHDDVDKSRERIDSETTKFTEEVGKETATVSGMIKDLTNASTNIQQDIINKVVALLTDKLGNTQGELQKKVEEAKATQETLSSNLVGLATQVSTLNRTASDRKSDLAKLDDLKGIADRIASSETRAENDAAKVDGFITTMSINAGLTTMLADISKNAVLYAQDDTGTRALGDNIGTIQHDLPLLEQKLRDLEGSVNLLRPLVNDAKDLREHVDDAVQRAEKAEMEAKEYTEKPLPEPSPLPPLATDPVILAINARIKSIQQSVNAARTPDLSYLTGADCKRIQQGLINVGTLRPAPSVKGRAQTNPVDGQCGPQTSLAMLAWQLRESRPISPAHTADEIIQTLNNPQTGQ
jgi:hypothetical protein